MSTLKYINQDLLLTDRQIIAHSVNAKGVFGAGVAKQVADKWPRVKNYYLGKHRDDDWNLGQVQFVPLDNIGVGAYWLVNMCTQETYGRTGLHTNYWAVELCLTYLFSFAQANALGVAMPKIGCGLGGGSWDTVESIIFRLLQEFSLELDIHYI